MHVFLTNYSKILLSYGCLNNCYRVAVCFGLFFVFFSRTSFTHLTRLLGKAICFFSQASAYFYTSFFLAAKIQNSCYQHLNCDTKMTFFWFKQLFESNTQMYTAFSD